MSSPTCSTSSSFPEKKRQTLKKTLQQISSTSPRTSSVDSSTPPIRPGGYEHPRSHKYVSISNSTCVNNVHDQDFQLACVQTYLDIGFYMIV